MPKRFTVSKNELNNVKDWLTNQIRKGRLPLLLSDIDTLHTAEDAQRLIDRTLDQEERKRLQVALSVRRNRNKSKAKKVTTELDFDAREILGRIALERNITTSELIRQTFGKEFLTLD